MATDRAALEEAIGNVEQYMLGACRAPAIRDLNILTAASRAHAETLPRTKMVEVHFVARVGADGKAIHYCESDTPDHRCECSANVQRYGGQMVLLAGKAEVPA